MDWILGRGVGDQNAVILWFYGPAGAGKSAIAKKIAELCDSEKRLLASFFFSRADPTRSNATSLIATIAYQIATNIPHTREKMFAAIERDPLIVTRSLEAQVAALVVDPLRDLLDAGYSDFLSSRRLVIIDGLDECENSAVQCEILDTISLLFRKYHLPLLILIASRPEQHLVHSFNCGSCHELHTTLALDNTYKPDEDIRLFLTDNLRQIKNTHPMRHYLDHSWPSVDVLNQLVEKSSGQFIYASIVVKYVLSIRHQPTERLNVVLGIRPPCHTCEMPFGELDALYRHIFMAIEDRETVLLILGVFWLHSLPRQHCQPLPMNIGSLEHFLLLNRGDIKMLFGDLSSVIMISNHYPSIHFLHASLPDFLFDAARSKEFYIDLSRIHTTCMHLCFQHIKQCMSTYFSTKEVAAYLLLRTVKTDNTFHFHFLGLRTTLSTPALPYTA
jgi:hypothetical protein